MAARRPLPPPPLPEGWCVYLLRCGDGSLYAGATNDLPRRVERHAAGRGAAYTRSRPPVALVWFEAAADRSAALRREAALKRLTRPQKLALLATSAAAASPRPAGAGRRARSAPSAPRTTRRT